MRDYRIFLRSQLLDHLRPEFSASFAGDGLDALPELCSRIRTCLANNALSSGARLPIVGALPGHADSATTQCFAHLSDDPPRSASDPVWARLANSLGKRIKMALQLLPLKREKGAR
jgi:hypothetical protein